MTVDFKKMLEELQDKTGKCSLINENYDTIDGIRIDCLKLQKQHVKLHYIFEEDERGLIFKILNGVTGYESFYVKDLLLNPVTEYWNACCLTRNHWDGLKVNGEQVLEKIRLKMHVYR